MKDENGTKNDKQSNNFIRDLSIWLYLFDDCTLNTIDTRLTINYLQIWDLWKTTNIWSFAVIQRGG